MSGLWLPGQPLESPPEGRDQDGLPVVYTGVPHDSVSAKLSYQDRQRLRAVARIALRKAGCPEAQNTTAEQDKYIDSLLRQTAEKMIKRAVEARLT